MAAPKQNLCNGPIFVTGVWKSGNHLVYSALNQLGIEGPFNGFAAHLLFGRGKVVKRAIRGAWPLTTGIDVGLETEARIRPGYLRSSIRRLRGRIVGGHAAYSEALLDLLLEEGARIVTIRRDPRDVLVSFADWIGERPDTYLHRDFAHLDREERILLLLRGGRGSGYHLHPFEDVLTRAAGWLKAPPGLQVAFEDIVGAKGGGTTAAQANAVRALHAHIGAEKPLTDVDPTRIYGGSLTFNKGRIARWRELGSRDLRDELKERLAAHLPAWGYAADEETSV